MIDIDEKQLFSRFYHSCLTALESESILGEDFNQLIK